MLFVDALQKHICHLLCLLFSLQNIFHQTRKIFSGETFPLLLSFTEIGSSIFEEKKKRCELDTMLPDE